MQAVTWFQRDAAGKIKNFMELKNLNVDNISQELIPEYIIKPKVSSSLYENSTTKSILNLRAYQI